MVVMSAQVWQQMGSLKYLDLRTSSWAEIDIRIENRLGLEQRLRPITEVFFAQDRLVWSI